MTTLLPPRGTARPLEIRPLLACCALATALWPAQASAQQPAPLPEPTAEREAPPPEPATAPEPEPAPEPTPRLVVAAPEPAPAPPEPAAPAPRRSAPQLVLTTEDGQSSISFRLTAQLRLERTETGLWLEDPDKRDGLTGLRLRRIRPEITGNLFGEDLRYDLHLNVVPGQLELIDLWIDYRFSPCVSVLIGQAKIPFTRYRMASFKDRPLVEWSYETRYFGTERQFGFMFHNGYNKPPELEYEIGVYSGVNARASNGVGVPTIYGEDIPNPSNLATAPTAALEPHPEVALHLAYNAGGIDVKRPTDLEGGPLRLSVGLSAAWDLHPTDRQDHVLRVAPEILLKVAGFSFTTVGYLSTCELQTGEREQTLCMLGSVVQASYVFATRYEIAMRYAGVLIQDDLRLDARQYAEDAIAAAAEEDREALEDRYKKTGRVRGEHEVNVGFNIYIFETTLKWQFDVGLLLHDLAGDRSGDFVARTQLQLAI